MPMRIGRTWLCLNRGSNVSFRSIPIFRRSMPLWVRTVLPCLVGVFVRHWSQKGQMELRDVKMPPEEVLVIFIGIKQKSGDLGKRTSGVGGK